MSLKTRIRYYWCVNCGKNGDYGYERQRGLVCEDCKYEDIVPMSAKEHEADLERKGSVAESETENENG